jgi:hypothetical protein
VGPRNKFRIGPNTVFRDHKTPVKTRDVRRL